MPSLPESAAAGGSALPPLVLKRQEERRLQAGHLWIFSNEVDVEATPLTDFEPGAHVAVQSSTGRFLGFAYVNPRTLISARLIGRDPDYPPGKSLLVHRLKVAEALRRRFSTTPFHRLVYGEGDFLPGLVVDRYGDVLVAQLGTAGMEAMKAEIQEALVKVVAPAALLWKNDSPIRELEGLPRYFDQTANRALFAGHTRGARVLDVFSYAGAFGLQAARAGAQAVTCVDSSGPALAAAAATAEANGLAAELREGDAFDLLTALHAERRRFDAVVVDPPAFIKRKKDHPKGLAAYRRVNQLAMRLLDRDGLLMSCSCSYHLAPGELVDAVQRAARHLGRFAQLVAVGGQSPDHPVHPAIDETRYLRAFLFRVTDG
jgi:23S rRNA (cytosine1962-C5)-methyltransferase